MKLTEIPEDPQAFAAMVAAASKSELEAMIASDREAILDRIFERMGEHFDRDKAEGLETVITWRIFERPDGSHDQFQAVIRDGACTVLRDGREPADVTVDFKPLDFIQAATGNVSGPRLFMFGRVKVQGDLVVAARISSLFRIPQRESGPVS